MKRREDVNFRKQKLRERLRLSVSPQKLQGLKLEDKFRKRKESEKMTEVAISY